MTSVEHRGVRYDQNTDWREFVRGLIAGDYPPGLDGGGRHASFSIFDEVGMLIEALEGTPMKSGLAAAALDELEQALAKGDEEALEMLRVLPYHLAPRALDRMTGILEAGVHRLPAGWVVCLISRSLELDPRNQRVLDVLAAALREPAPDPDVFTLAARYIPERLASELAKISVTVDTPRALWILLAPRDARQRLLSAIANLGEAHVRALIDQVLDPRFPHEPREELLAELRANPLFAAKIAG